MIFWISLLNDLSVSIFGSVLSASFCNALNSRRNRWIFWCSMALIPILQSYLYSICSDSFLLRFYPVILHFPLLLELIFLTRKVLWSVVSVFTAYLCCQLRRWIALFAAAIFSGGELMQNSAELIITLPLLFLLLRYISPVLKQTALHSFRDQFKFGIIPALYYGFDYITRIYTDLLSKGTPVAVEFMPFVCCTAYLFFLLYNSAEEQKQNRLEQIQKTLSVQMMQAVREINTLRESQSLARQYRHDLRHHLQFILSSIENGQTEQVRTYISEIDNKICSQEIFQYCENEAANLILSSFAERAKKENITLKIQGVLPVCIKISDMDLCVLLSNALENALNASRVFAASGKESTIDVRFFEKDKKLFLQITNPCGTDVRFENGIPVTDREGHGIGIQSICAIVDRYNGVYSFHIQNGRFILRLSI